MSKHVIVMVKSKPNWTKSVQSYSVYFSFFSINCKIADSKFYAIPVLILKYSEECHYKVWRCMKLTQEGGNEIEKWQIHRVLDFKTCQILPEWWHFGKYLSCGLAEIIR